MVILRALQRNPARRYQSAQEFIKDLLLLREHAQGNSEIIRALPHSSRAGLPALSAKEPEGGVWDCIQETAILPQSAVAQPNRAKPASVKRPSRSRARSESYVYRHLAAACAGIVLGFFTFLTAGDFISPAGKGKLLESIEESPDLEAATADRQGPGGSRAVAEDPSLAVLAEIKSELGEGPRLEFGGERAPAGRKYGRLVAPERVKVVEVATPMPQQLALAEAVDSVNRALASGGAEEVGAGHKPRLLDHTVDISFARPQVEERSLPQYRVMGAMLYRLANYVTWPKRTNVAVVNICVVGEDPFKNFLARNLGQAESRMKRRFAVSTYSADATVAELSACNIVFTGGAHLGELLDQLVLRGILTVTEGTGQGIIDFMVRSSRIRFSLNERKAQKGGLVLASSLFDLADHQ